MPHHRDGISPGPPRQPGNPCTDDGVDDDRGEGNPRRPRPLQRLESRHGVRTEPCSLPGCIHGRNADCRIGMGLTGSLIPSLRDRVGTDGSFAPGYTNRKTIADSRPASPRPLPGCSLPPGPSLRMAIEREGYIGRSHNQTTLPCSLQAHHKPPPHTHCDVLPIRCGTHPFHLSPLAYRRKMVTGFLGVVRITKRHTEVLHGIKRWAVDGCRWHGTDACVVLPTRPGKRA